MMSETESDTEHATAPLTNDAEFNAVLTALMGMDSRDSAKWDSPVCKECGRMDAVETDSRRKVNMTVKRHTCTRCDTHGATLVDVNHGPGPARVSSGGDVETVDLSLDENAEYRGTAVPEGEN